MKRNTLFYRIHNLVASALRYIRESRFYVYAIIILFCLSVVIGFLFSENFFFLEDFLRELVDQTRGLSLPQLILFIFFNNVQSSLFGLFFGVFLGIFSILVVVLNGVVVGYVLERAWQLSGVSDFWRLFPHGIFELPAVFISLGLGLKLGLFIFNSAPKSTFIYRIYHSVLVFLFVVIPLLIAAAIIEGILILIYA